MRIMKGTNLSTIKTVMLATVLLLSFVITPAAQAGVPSSIGTLEGPYFKELRFKIYATSEAEVAGLLSGDVDVVDFFEAEQIPDIQSGLDSGELETAQNAEQGMWGFSLQTERYPLNLVEFRRAIAYLCDKDKYVREGLQGLGYKLETFLGSPGYGVWSGTTYTTYDFSPTKAAELLTSIGFVKGADGKLIDPQTGTTMRPLVILARTEHPHRIFAARELAQQFDAVGIVYDLQEVPRSVASPLVFLEQDYDIYTAGWGGGPDVDWLYDLFYSTSPPSQNFQLFKNATVDAALDQLKFGKSGEEVLEGAQLAQQYLSEQLPFIPLYAKAYLSPYNARLTNVIDLPWWSGVTNAFTFTFATDKTQQYGGVLNIGWTSDPQQPSPMYEINWWWDTMLNNVIYDTPIQLDPTTFEELPWMAKSWSTEPWTTPDGYDGTKITFTLNQGIKWHDGLELTAEDVVFTWDYALEQENPVYISYLSSYIKGETPDKYTAVAYMNTTSYWALHWVGSNIPIIPKHIWENIEDSVTYQPISEGNLIGTGPYIFKEYKPGEYVVVTANPNYFMKPAGSTLTFTEVKMVQGETKVYTSNKAVYNGVAVTNGTYTITVKTGATTVKTFTGTTNTDGSYTATLDTKDLTPGTYDMYVELAVKVGIAGLGSFDEYKLTVSEKPVDYVFYGGILAAVVVVVAAGYIVLKRQQKK